MTAKPQVMIFQRVVERQEPNTLAIQQFKKYLLMAPSCSGQGSEYQGN